MTPADAFDPPTGVARNLRPETGLDLRRIVAPNPSPMTYHGTNTYLLGGRDLAVIDPGPLDEGHLQAILAAVRPAERITHILVTHAHLDHSSLARRLAEITGAPVFAFGNAEAGRSVTMQGLVAGGLVGGGEGVDIGFAPDIALRDGQEILSESWRLAAHWTPGHFGNHMSFQVEDIVFTGDMVMEWASSLVSPPDGDLTDFMASCHRLRQLGARVLLPGHGAPVTDPAARIDWLIAHRLGRETAILDLLAKSPATVHALTTAIYTQTPRALLSAAERNVLAHLIDLHQRGHITPVGPLRTEAKFRIS